MLLPEATPEPDEQFRVILTNATGGTLGTATATVNILDSLSTVPHHISSITRQPNSEFQIRLGGTVDSHFAWLYDIYPVDYSSDLVSWQRLATLVRTNGDTAPPQLTDVPTPGVNRRFYRTAGGPWISAWPKLPGPFPIGIVHPQLCDPTRLNRYGVPTNGSFMISVIYPALKTTGALSPYVDQAIADDPT